MKVKQVVGEHKKGFRAKKYASKPKPYIEPHKPNAPEKMDEEMPGQMVGKVQQVKPDGTVDIQKPSGDTTTVQATALQPGDNNKLTMQVPKIQPGMEVDAEKTIEEEPDVPYYVQAGPQPMAKTGGRGNTPIVPSKLWTAITPEVQTTAERQGFRKVMLQYNNKKFFGLEGGDKKLGSKIIVSPSDYQVLTTPTSSNGPATPANDEQPGMLRRAVRSVGNYLQKMDQDRDEQLGINRGNPGQYNEVATPVKEAADDQLLNKMLTIAGLR